VRDTAAVLDAVHGSAPGDPYVAPEPERPYLDEVSAEPDPLRIGLTTQPFLDVAPDPAVVEAALDAGRLLESLGHDVEEGGPGRLEGVDLVDTFLTRWMAGQATVLDQLGLLLGREVGPEDVEPLTWALAEEGRRRSASQ
jgi:Asp-tRNA(Asn)/Glu-tRNA(Gln) amidotransferase A subunit family amidase